MTTAFGNGIFFKSLKPLSLLTIKSVFVATAQSKYLSSSGLVESKNLYQALTDSMFLRFIIVESVFSAASKPMCSPIIYSYSAKISVVKYSVNF